MIEREFLSTMDPATAEELEEFTDGLSIEMVAVPEVLLEPDEALRERLEEILLGDGLTGACEVLPEAVGHLLRGRGEKNLGIPLPASTQWDIVEGLSRLVAPAYHQLIREAAQGDVLHNDDTPVKILELMEENKEKRRRKVDDG